MENLRTYGSHRADSIESGMPKATFLSGLKTNTRKRLLHFRNEEWYKAQ